MDSSDESDGPVVSKRPAPTAAAAPKATSPEDSDSSSDAGFRRKRHRKPKGRAPAPAPLKKNKRTAAPVAEEKDVSDAAPSEEDVDGSPMDDHAPVDVRYAGPPAHVLCEGDVTFSARLRKGGASGDAVSGTLAEQPCCGRVHRCHSLLQQAETKYFKLQLVRARGGASWPAGGAAMTFATSRCAAQEQQARRQPLRLQQVGPCVDVGPGRAAPGRRR